MDRALMLAAIFCIALVIGIVKVPKGRSDDPPQTVTVTTTDTRYEALRKRFRRLQGYSVRIERQRNGLRRVLLHRSSVGEAINLACATYGHCSELWRKARCESHLNPYARNGSEASGLFQFLPSTWRSTPYGGFSVWSANANALAAGWMHSRGRGGEWVCR